MHPRRPDYQQLPQDISGRIAQRWNHMVNVLTKQGKQGVPPEFDTVLTMHANFNFLDKYCILPGQEANSSQHEQQNFTKIRTQFIVDCSNAVKQGLKTFYWARSPSHLQEQHYLLRKHRLSQPQRPPPPPPPPPLRSHLRQEKHRLIPPPPRQVQGEEQVKARTRRVGEYHSKVSVMEQQQTTS